MDYIVVTGGGTGGHVFPGLAVAEEIAAVSRVGIVWFGSKQGIEADLVSAASVPGLVFCPIPAGKLRRYFSLRNVTDVFRIAAAFILCLVRFIRSRPLAVFSKGGFVSVPPVWAAGILRIPVYSHESDFDPGLATKLNLRFSSRIFAAYPESVEHFPPAVRPRVEVTGNPIRRAIFRGKREELEGFFPGALRARAEGKKILAVLGGSLGAVQLNDLIRENLDRLTRDFIVIHQHGNRWDAPEEQPGAYYPHAFLGDEIAHLLAAADLAAARAGAGTLWELAAWRVPALLVPLTEGSRGDQVLNARYFDKMGSCRFLIDPDAEEFGRRLLELGSNDVERRRMASAYATLKTGAAETIAQELLLQEGV